MNVHTNYALTFKNLNDLASGTLSDDVQFKPQQGFFGVLKKNTEGQPLVTVFGTGGGTTTLSQNRAVRKAVLQSLFRQDTDARGEEVLGLQATAINHRKEFTDFLTAGGEGSKLTLGEIRGLLRTLKLLKSLDDELNSKPPSGQKPSSAKGKVSVPPPVPEKANDKPPVPEKANDKPPVPEKANDKPSGPANANEKTSQKPQKQPPKTMGSFLKAMGGSNASKKLMPSQQPRPVNVRPITIKNGTRPSVFINKPVNQPVNQAKPKPEGQQKSLGQRNVTVVQVGQRINRNDSDSGPTVVRLLSKKVFKNRVDFAEKNLSPDKLRGARPVSQQKKPDTEMHTGQDVQKEVANQQVLQKGKKKGKKPTTFSNKENSN